jgi:hypothetical protein
MNEQETLVASTENLPTMQAPEQVQAWSLDTDEIPSAYGRGISTALAVLVVRHACLGSLHCSWVGLQFLSTPGHNSTRPSRLVPPIRFLFRKFEVAVYLPVRLTSV